MSTTVQSSASKFTDRTGRAWVIALDFAALQRIKDGAGVDLGAVERLAETWAKLLYDDLQALSVLWLSLKSSADVQGISREQFAEGFDGEVLERAIEALEVAVVSFTQPRKRGLAQRAIEGLRDGMAKAIAQAEKKLDEAMQDATTRALETLGS